MYLVLLMNKSKAIQKLLQNRDDEEQVGVVLIPFRKAVKTCNDASTVDKIFQIDVA